MRIENEEKKSERKKSDARKMRIEKMMWEIKRRDRVMWENVIKKLKYVWVYFFLKKIISKFLKILFPNFFKKESNFTK